MNKIMTIEGSVYPTVDDVKYMDYLDGLYFETTGHHFGLLLFKADPVAFRSGRDAWLALQKKDDPDAKIEALEDALTRIEQWTLAYPLSVFPEPDWKKARTVLEEHGMTLDSISAGAMRRVVEGIAEIIEEARRD